MDRAKPPDHLEGESSHRQEEGASSQVGVGPNESQIDLPHFARFLSHELRQPLNSISLWTDLLGSTQSLDEKGRGYLGRILEEIGRLSRIVDEQLILAQVSSNPLEVGWVELGELVEEARAELSEILEESGARMVVEDLPQVYSDPKLLRPVFRNLIVNAVCHRRPKVAPRIRVWAREPEIFEGMACEVLVEDNGPGFAPEDAERMFTMFERLEPDGSDGTGLGLTLCRHAMDRLGGTIRALDRSGEGATFVLGLPEFRVEDCPTN